VRIHETRPCSSWSAARKPVVKTAQGECACDFVVLAGNVYLGEYGDDVAPEVSPRIMPVGTYIIATAPMGATRADALMPQRCAASDTNFILDYFRLTADHRLLFGGGDSYTGTHAAQPGRHASAAACWRCFPQLDDLAVTTPGAASSTSP
jgi:gamma-glutamylputrescine oxidase